MNEIRNHFLFVNVLVNSVNIALLSSYNVLVIMLRKMNWLIHVL